MLKQRRNTERQIALFLLGGVMLVPPVLVLFNHPDRVAGIPSLYLYIFLVWTGLIGFTLAITRRMRLDELAARENRQADVEPLAPASVDGHADA
ncbi:MAG: hypothetical protein ABL893_07130 [Hyphomicrobium sp.]|nr:hypothetical protein [Hyphomicrobium sp.]